MFVAAKLTLTLRMQKSSVVQPSILLEVITLTFDPANSLVGSLFGQF